MSPQPVVLTEVINRIGVITMNRPERRNALNGALIEALDEAVQAMAGDNGVKVVVLTGAAGKNTHGGFCAGGDIKEGGTKKPNALGFTPASGPDDLHHNDLHAGLLLHMMHKPTIAMIGGPAVGAGCSLAAACDLRYMADDALLSSNFSANGLSGDYGGSYYWTRIIGTSRTRELYYLNDKIDADKALHWGMVNDVFPAAELQARTMAIAERLLRIPGSLLSLVKDNLTQAEDDVQRRRHLYDVEIRNQKQAGADIAERMRRRAGRDAT